MTDEIQVPPPPASDPQPESTPFGTGVPVEAVRLSPSERRGPSIDVQAQSTPWVPPAASSPSPPPSPQPSLPPAAPVQPAPAYSGSTPTWSGGGSAAAPAASTAGLAAACGAAAAPGFGPPPPAAPASPAAKAASRNRWWVALCHLSYLIPTNLPGLIFTTLVWIWRRERDPVMADQGREALNMQLTYWLVILLLTVTVIGWPLIPFVWFLGAILSVLAAIAASNGERYRYPFIWRILA